jgi:hypothetical protein
MSARGLLSAIGALKVTIKKQNEGAAHTVDRRLDEPRSNGSLNALYFVAAYYPE